MAPPVFYIRFTCMSIGWETDNLVFHLCINVTAGNHSLHLHSHSRNSYPSIKIYFIEENNESLTH